MTPAIQNEMTRTNNAGRGRAMLAIRFSDETRQEDGLRLIMSNGPVRFTGTRGIYQVPPYILGLLNAADIPYQRTEI